MENIQFNAEELFVAYKHAPQAEVVYTKSSDNKVKIRISKDAREQYLGKDAKFMDVAYHAKGNFFAIRPSTDEESARKLVFDSKKKHAFVDFQCSNLPVFDGKVLLNSFTKDNNSDYWYVKLPQQSEVSAS
jgi:hypothetical protein